jgi:ATP-dependent Lhr-like helicase
VALNRVSPLAAPLFLEAGKIPIKGAAQETMLARAAEQAMAAAGLAP